LRWAWPPERQPFKSRIRRNEMLASRPAICFLHRERRLLKFTGVRQGIA
jgi:hypothetical protein